ALRGTERGGRAARERRDQAPPPPARKGACLGPLPLRRTVCNRCCRAGAGGGIGVTIPTHRAVGGSPVKTPAMDATQRGNYESGADYVLEYGELRFTFNERDFTERVEQAAVKLGFVPGPLV